MHRISSLSTSKIGALCLFAGAAIWTTTAITAPNPSSGDLSESKTSLQYTGGPLAVLDPDGGTCEDNAAITETFTLRTVGLSAEYAASHSLKIELAPVTEGDVILTLRHTDGTAAQFSDGGFVGAGESISLQAAAGTKTYRVQVCLFAGTAATYNVRADLVLQASGGGGFPTPCDGDTFGGPDLTCAGVPRYQLFTPPRTASYAQAGSGEYNIGYNHVTRRIMHSNNVPVARVTPAEIKKDGSGGDSGLPEACPELWENKTNTTGTTTLDPILWTDVKTGRTFSSNQTTGTNGAYAYTDDDGESWIEIGIGPPSGGIDHQTIGSGPFPSGLGALTTPQNQGQYVLYCTQNLVGSVCQRSLTLGSTWENGQVATGPGTRNSKGCGGLHGHVRVAPDGAAWMPDKSCGSNQGGGISLDASATPWYEFSVSGIDDRTGAAFSSTPQSPGGSDPSIAFDQNNTIYYCYVNNEAGGTEGRVHVAVGTRTGSNVTWKRDSEVGASHGIKNSAFTEAWGGSPGRAACAFLGTNKAGDYQNADPNPGMDWYGYVATTYDEGRTWVTVNVTPNDPVQHNAGIWQQGGGNNNRNLLDFNEITMDDKGRILFGFSDGCVTPGCVAKTAGNDYVADMRVSRQIGGKSLLASFDAQTDTNDGLNDTGPINPKILPPKRACLLDSELKHPTPSTRDATTAHLLWRAPDNGGGKIVNYDIYRSTTAADPMPVKIATTADAKPQYDDTTAGSTDPFLYYRIKANTAGALVSPFSNELKLQIGSGSGTPCVLPGILVVNDLLETGGDNDSGVNIPPTESLNVKSLLLAEPYLGAGVKKLVFTLQVGPDVAASPSSEWYIIWNRTTVATDGSDRAYVAMLTDASGTPRFEYGNFGPPLPLTSPPPPPNANSPTPLGLADRGSYNVATGVITITLSASLAENRGAGDSLAGLNVRTFAGRYSGDPNAPRGQKSQNNASEITGNGSYTLFGNEFCAPNLEPIAILSVDPQTGGDAPLTVLLDGTASSDPDDSVASYTFDFGDGNVAVTQSSPTLSHTYELPGQYQARLTVRDSKGLPSLETVDSVRTIDVFGVAISRFDNNRLGGALSIFGLLSLGMATMLRRRKRH